jgi:predicted transcriptional regulator of viral defense system
MTSIPQHIENLGGVASLRELVRAGVPRDWVLMFAEYGLIERVREGWYALHGNPPDLVEAWRIGGRLGCVSALAFYGFAAAPRQVHVAVPANASRLRHGDAIIHWSRTNLGGDRQAVGIGAAVRQASRCPHVPRDSL